MLEDLLGLEHCPWTYQLRRVLPLKSPNLLVESLRMLYVALACWVDPVELAEVEDA